MKYLILLLVLMSCGRHDIRSYDHATDAMERAKAAEAHIYAPEEYRIADSLYNKMNQELSEEKENEAYDTSHKVIEAANIAIRIAYRNRSALK